MVLHTRDYFVVVLGKSTSLLYLTSVYSCFCRTTIIFNCSVHIVELSVICFDKTDYLISVYAAKSNLIAI